MPSVNKIYGELKDKGLEVALISFRENADVVKRAVKERGYIAPVLLDENGDVTGRAYGVWGPPTVYFVDREGRSSAVRWGRATGRRRRRAGSSRRCSMRAGSEGRGREPATQRGRALSNAA